MIDFFRPYLSADHPENRPPMAVPAVYVEATAAIYFRKSDNF